MLKKVIIASTATAVALLGAAGVANATDSAGSPQCVSHETTKQFNKGDQLLGGNSDIRHINGFWSGSIEKPGVCPSVGNNNKIG